MTKVHRSSGKTSPKIWGGVGCRDTWLTPSFLPACFMNTWKFSTESLCSELELDESAKATTQVLTRQRPNLDITPNPTPLFSKGFRPETWGLTPSPSCLPTSVFHCSHPPFSSVQCVKAQLRFVANSGRQCCITGDVEESSSLDFHLFCG